MAIYDVEIKFADGQVPRMGWLIEADTTSAALRSVFEVFESDDIYQINIKKTEKYQQVWVGQHKVKGAFEKVKHDAESDAEYDPFRVAQIQIDRETNRYSQPPMKDKDV